MPSDGSKAKSTLGFRGKLSGAGNHRLAQRNEALEWKCQRVSVILMPVDIGPYSKIPNRFFGSGKAAALGPSASFTYVALCEHANRAGRNRFRASDRALAADTGLSTRTICEARKRLIENQLVLCAREEGQSYTYTLERPELRWVPIKQRPRRKKNPRGNSRLPGL